MRTGWLGTLAATALVTVACSISATPPSALGPATSNLALVTLSGSNDIVVGDITDVSHPKIIGTLGIYPVPQGAGPAMEGAAGQFISATAVAYRSGSTDASFGLPTGLFRVPLSGSPATPIIKGSQAVIVFSWSPDGGTLVYVTAGDSGSELHQLKAGQDRVLASVPPPGLGGGCEVAPCPGPFQNPGDGWDFRLSYSADGALISMAQNSITSYLRIWNAQGEVLGSLDSQVVTMSVWSGARLYFRDSKGVEAWRDGVVSTFLPGVAWIRPKASPDGAHIVYEARDQQGSAHVFIVDTATRMVRDLGKGRAEPAFLTSRYIWYEAEPACVAAGTCEPGFPGIATGKTYIYDLRDNTESGSVITSVLDVWPHPE